MDEWTCWSVSVQVDDSTTNSGENAHVNRDGPEKSLILQQKHVIDVLTPPFHYFWQPNTRADTASIRDKTVRASAWVAATWSMGNHQLSSFSNCWEMINVHTG